MPGEEKPEEAEAAPAGGGKKAVIIKWAIVCAILLLFIGIEVGIAVFFVNKLKEPDFVDTKQQEEEAEKQAALKAQTEVGANLAAPIEVTVNILGEDGRFLKCGVQLEYSLSDALMANEIEIRKPRIKDIIIDIMSSKPLSELMTNDGKKAIREQIVREVNAVLPEDVSGKPLSKIQRSYFDSFIVQ
jgi:flagellar FliL protein